MATRRKVATVDASASRLSEVIGRPMLSGWHGPTNLHLMTRRSLLSILCAAAFVGAACAGDGGTPDPVASGGSRFGGAFAGAKAYPVFASSEVVVGENRFLVGLLNDNDAPIGSAGIAMHIEFYDLEESETEPVFGRDMEFIETIPGERSLYKTTAVFDSAGR